MKPPFRFGPRRPPELSHERATGTADSWEMLRGPRAPAAEADVEAAPPPPAPDVRRADRPAPAPQRRSAAGGAVGYAGPNRIETWREIRTIESLGRLTEPHRLRMHMPMPSGPPAPLFQARTLPERVAAPHRSRKGAPPAEFF